MTYVAPIACMLSEQVTGLISDRISIRNELFEIILKEVLSLRAGKLCNCEASVLL